MNINEEYFWASLFKFSTSGPKEKARIQKRLESECKQYVALKLAEMTKQPTSHIYPGSSDDLLRKAEEKYREIWSEERDRTHAEAPETGAGTSHKKWWQFWK